MYVKLSWRPEVDANWAIMVVQPTILTYPTMFFLLLTCSTGPMEWSTGNSYQAEALTNVLRYHTCRSSHLEDRKLPITELKWDARTVTDISGSTAYFFLAFFWLTEGSRNKKLDICIKQIHLRTYLLRYLVIRAAMGTGRGWKHR